VNMTKLWMRRCSTGRVIADLRVLIAVCTIGAGWAAIAAPLAGAATPIVMIDPNPIAGYTTAHISGEIDPGTEEVQFYAEFRRKGAVESWHERFVELIPANAGPTPVSTDIEGLAPGTEYEFRLDAFIPSQGEFTSPVPGPSAMTKAVETSPTVSMEPVSGVFPTTAHFAGHVNPNAPEAAPVSADVSAAFGVNWHFQCNPSCPGLAGGTVAADDTAQVVEADASELLPGTSYEVELIAENAGGALTRVIAGPVQFTTLAVPPTVANPAAAETSATEATLHAQINPGGAPTTFRFEYLTKGQYEAAGGFVGPDLRSTPGTSLGFSDNEPHEASATVSGLEPGATYYFRAVVTSNSPGNPTIESQAKAFIAYAGPGAEEAPNCPNEQLRSETNSLSLADCRAYEQVTPSYKQSHGIYVGRGGIAPDGSSVIAASLGVFAGTEDLPRGPGELIGAADYRFDWTPQGWQTTALEPPAGAVLVNGGSGSLLVPTVSAKGMLFMLSTDKVPHGEEFYVRQPDGALTFLGQVQNPASPGLGESDAGTLRGASADDSHVFFRVVRSRWPGDTTVANGAFSLYEASGSVEPKLVGVTNLGPLQSNSEANLISDCGTEVAAAENERRHSVSSGGDLVYFRVQSTSENCEGFGGTGPTVEELYVRVDGEKTIPISEPILPVGEECTGACAAGEPRPAEFQGAIEDGRRVFFKTSQPLLSADRDETADLYEAEILGSGTAARLGSLTLITIGGATDPTPGEGARALGIVGYSANGLQAYLAAEGVLTSAPNVTGETAQAGEPNLYVVNTDTGAVTFVVTLGPEDEESWLGNASFAQVTPDGRYLVVKSSATLTPDDTSPGVRQLFEYDAQSRSLVRVSAGDRGYNDDGNTTEGGANLSPLVEFRQSRSIANDGTVFFTSSIALTPGASSDPEHLLKNIYEFRDGRVYLIAPGVGLNDENGDPEESATRLWGTDESGDDVFFSTLAQLTPTDVDGRPDLYDAHVDGGFPTPAVPANCAASASCQGSATPAPAFSPPATATFVGPPNKKKHHKKKHHKKKHHKKKHHKKKHHKSSRSRRAGK
jgi:hypothetical protein